MNAFTFNAGDKVSFTVVRRVGQHGFRFSSHEGTFLESNGESATVAARGRSLLVAHSSLRPVGADNQLTESFRQTSEGGPR